MMRGRISPNRLARSTGFLWCLVWLSLAIPCWSQSIVLHLKNGDRISGTIVSEGTNEVVVTTPYLGKLTIPAEQIDRREVIPAPSASPAQTPPVAATPPAPAQTPPAPTPPPPVATVTAPATPKPPEPIATNQTAKAAEPGAFLALWDNISQFLAHWTGDVQLGANLGYGTKNRQTYTGRINAVHSRDSLRNILTLDGAYGTTAGVLSDNRMDGRWRLEHDFGKAKRFLAYLDSGAGYDEIRQIEFQYDVGPGVGYKVLVLTNFVLKLESGGNYQVQIYQNTGSQERYSLRFAEAITWQPTPKLKIDQRFEFFPKVNEFSEYRFRLEGNITYLIGQKLSLTLNVVDIYDTSTPPGVTPNDLQIRSLLGIKF